MRKLSGTWALCCSKNGLEKPWGVHMKSTSMSSSGVELENTRSVSPVRP